MSEDVDPDILGILELDEPQGTCEQYQKVEENPVKCEETAEFAVVIDRDLTDDGFKPGVTLACGDCWTIDPDDADVLEARER